MIGAWLTFDSLMIVGYQQMLWLGPVNTRLLLTLLFAGHSMGQEKAEWALCASSPADPLDLVWTKQQAEQGGWETFGGNFVTHILCKSLLVCSVIGLGGTDHVTESSKVLYRMGGVASRIFSLTCFSPCCVCILLLRMVTSLPSRISPFCPQQWDPQNYTVVWAFVCLL